MHSQQMHNNTTLVWVDERASHCSLDANCSWVCFPAGTLEFALSCQAVFLAEYHSHPEKLDHAVIQPVFMHRHINTQTHTQNSQSQACSVTLQLCWVISLSTDSEMKSVVCVYVCVRCKLLKYTVMASSPMVVGRSAALCGQLSFWIFKVNS